MISLIRLVAGLALAVAAGCAPMRATGSPDGAMSGIWEEQIVRDGRDIPFSVLTVELRVSDSAVSGRYCFVTRFGSRMDCDPEGRDNIRGRVTEAGVASIHFTSSFGGEDGSATLRRDGQRLLWQTIVPPSDDRFLGPHSATLRRAE